MAHGVSRRLSASLLASFCTLLAIQGWLLPTTAYGKTQTNLLTQDEIALIRKNRTWPGVSVDNSLALANKWMKYSIQELRDKVPPASVPRAFDVHFAQDPQHPEQIKSYGPYPWIIDPDKPYKVICPYGGEVFPTNDFDPQHVGSPADVSSTPYVDNGWGYRKPGDPQKYWFVAYYAHWLYMNHLQPASVALAQAYVITGDQKYARQAAALLDRIAEEYPRMNYESQSRYGTEIQPGNYPGRIVNSIWETGLVENFATAYDYIYPALANDTVLEQALGKSAAQIQANIEQNLLEEAARSIYTEDGRIRGNFGMHQSTLALIAIVLDNQNTGKYLDKVINGTGVGNWQYQGVVTGLANLVFRDGAPNESSPGYNSLWITQFDQVAVQLLRRGINLYQQEPKLRALFEYPLRLVMAGNFTPNIGDTGYVTSSGIAGWSQNTFSTAYQQYGERAFVYGTPLTQESDNMSAYGLAMLRTGTGTNAAGVALYYGPGGGHDHYDRLNVELFAKGMRISPDLGYPEYASAQDKQRFAFNGHTISHNAVVVNQQRQSTKNGGRIQTFNTTPHVQYVDVRAEEAYPAMVQQYRRSVALIDASNENSYVVDIFRVQGGFQHDYSLHGPAGTVAVNNINLMQMKGTLAGEDVPFSYLYDAPQMEKPGYTGGYTGYMGSGFSYLTNVQHGVPTGIWDADWTATGSQTHLRATFVPQPGSEVFLADGQPPQNKVGNPKWLKYVIVRNKATERNQLDSSFVTVWQPYNGSPFISRISRLESANTRDKDTVALQIAHTDGTDYVLQSASGDPYASTDGSLSFTGKLGVLSLTPGGILRHANLVGGGALQYQDVSIQTAGSYTGQVLAVDYKASKLTVRLAPEAPDMPVGDILAKQRIVFANDKHATEYVIALVKRLDDRVYEIQLAEKELQTGKGVVSYVTPNGIGSQTQLVLNQYYVGQWLVNPVNGQGSRIKSVSGSGSGFTLDNGRLGLQPEGDFCIYDFGAGDQFTLTSSISITSSITSEDDGIYVVTSNVPGRVRLWDGVERSVTPGTTRFSIPLIGVRIANPAEAAKIHGVIQPQFALDIPESLALTQFRMLLDGRELYNDKRVPAYGEISIDTTQHTDGHHTLELTATDQYGRSVAKTVDFTITNWWEKVTELPAVISSGWFGTIDFTHIYEKSAGWLFVENNPDDFAGDNDRMVRAKDGMEYIIWEAPQLKRFELAVLAKAGAAPAENISAGVALSVSADGIAWQPVAFRAELVQTTAAGWQQWRLSQDVSLVQTPTRYFRVQFLDAVPAADLQLGRVLLQGRVE